MHQNEKRGFASYNHLSPLPEYACVRKRPISDVMLNSSLEMNPAMTSVPFGNSYGVEYGGVRQSVNRAESTFSCTPIALQPTPAISKREVSVSYNDLTKDFGNNWQSSEDYPNRSPLNARATSYTMPPNLGSSEKYFRSLNDDIHSNINMTKMPSRSTMLEAGAEFQDFSSTRETEIH